MISAIVRKFIMQYMIKYDKKSKYFHEKSLFVEMFANVYENIFLDIRR